MKNNKNTHKIKNKTNKNIKKQKISIQKKSLNTENIIPTKNLKIILLIVFFILFMLICRLFYLQIIDGPYLSSLASKTHTTSETINSKRGNIYDSTGASLAISEAVDTVSINPAKIKAKKDADTPALKEKVAKALSDIFELDYNDTLAKVNSSASSVNIVKKVEEDKIDKLKSWMKENNVNIGINIDEDSKRYYPYGNLASQVIGSCGTDSQGQSGIEYSYDSILRGVSGNLITSIGASKTEIPNSEQSFIPAENGYNLTLTLDIHIQRLVEKYLQEAVEEHSCSNGGNAIVMNPQTGEILAMASYPTYDLNSPRTPTSFYADNWDSLSSKEQYDRIFQMWKVRSVSETYEPGSVFKLITAAVALEENKATTDKPGDFRCDGAETIYDATIRCWYNQAPYFSSHGYESLREALMDSCNPSFMQLSKRIGAETLYKYYDAFGLFDKTGVGLSGEESGIFFDLNKVGPVELATMSFGQRFKITPLQMCNAICAIANNGNLLQPKIVKSMTNTDTGEVTNFDTKIVRKVLSSETAEKMKSMMESVVTGGTGKRAQVEGYTIGGKSGTSEPIASDKKAGYTTSFAAISPIENTQVVVLVTLYNPTGNSHQGGQTAAPVVAKILKETLPYLGIEPNN
ncbi:MAG TPA: hypothetical protein DEP51_00185 [Clostridiales bacterium]|nr:hypothetical protein [Clostridiales bacterium]